MNLEPTNQFNEFETYDDFSNLNTNNLLLEIWLKPKLVFKYLFKTNPEKYVWPLMIIAGAINGLEKSFEKFSNYNDSYQLGLTIGMIIGGALLGWVSYFIPAWIMSVFGSAFLNGTAKAKSFRTVLAWGSIPNITTILFSLLLVIIYRNDILSDDADLNQTEGIALLVVIVIQVGLGIWSTILVTQGVKHIQNFKTVRALVNVLLPFIIIFVVFAAFFIIGGLF